MCTVKIMSPIVQILTPRPANIFTPSQVMVLMQEIQTEVLRARLKRSDSKSLIILLTYSV